MLVFGATYGFAIDSHRLESKRCVQLRFQPGAQGELKRIDIDPGQNAMQRTDTRRTTSEAEYGTTPRLVGSSPFGNGEQTPSTAQHAATETRQHGGKGVTATGRPASIGHRRQGAEQ